MLRVFNSTARYVDQGGGKRNGSIAIYLEPHHPDIESFLELKNHGDEELHARDLFYGLWISDLFMKRVHNNEEWSLFVLILRLDCQMFMELSMNHYIINTRKKESIKKLQARDLD